LFKTLIIYDSIFGNTEKIARAIGGSLGSQAEVGTLRVGDMQPEQLTGLELLIVGSPTRGFRPTPAIAAFLKTIPANNLKGIRVAAFDTRLSVKDVNNILLNILARIFGYAAAPIAASLTKNGGVLALPPEGFFVKASEGPLKEGELERSAAWGKQIKM